MNPLGVPSVAEYRAARVNAFLAAMPAYSPQNAAPPGEPTPGTAAAAAAAAHAAQATFRARNLCYHCYEPTKQIFVTLSHTF
jgi:hypothetical protein